MTNDESESEQIIPSRRHEVSTCLRTSAYSEKIDWERLHSSFEAVPVAASVTEAYILGKKRAWSKQAKHDSKGTSTASSKVPGSTETYDSKTSGYESDTTTYREYQPEFTFMYSDPPLKHTTGFQGHPIKSKNSRLPKRANVAFGSSSKRVTNSENLRERYQKVMDSNRNFHFVHSSFVKGKKVKRINKLPPLQRPTEDTADVINIRKLESEKERQLRTLRLSVFSPPVPVAPHQSFISENTEYQQYVMAGNSSDSEPPSDFDDDDNDIPLNVPRRAVHIDLPRVYVQSYFDNERIEEIQSRENMEVSSVQDDLETSVCTPLSYDALQQHNKLINESTLKPKQQNNACGLTDITERGESNLTRTSVTNQSEMDVKMSIRINFKQSVHAIDERSNLSEEILVPRPSRGGRRRRSRNGDRLLDQTSSLIEQKNDSSDIYNTDYMMQSDNQIVQETEELNSDDKVSDAMGDLSISEKDQFGDTKSSGSQHVGHIQTTVETRYKTNTDNSGNTHNKSVQRKADVCKNYSEFDHKEINDAGANKLDFRETCSQDTDSFKYENNSSGTGGGVTYATLKDAQHNPKPEPHLHISCDNSEQSQPSRGYTIVASSFQSKDSVVRQHNLGNIKHQNVIRETENKHDQQVTAQGDITILLGEPTNYDNSCVSPSDSPITRADSDIKRDHVSHDDQNNFEGAGCEPGQEPNNGLPNSDDTEHAPGQYWKHAESFFFTDLSELDEDARQNVEQQGLNVDKDVMVKNERTHPHVEVR